MGGEKRDSEGELWSQTVTVGLRVLPALTCWDWPLIFNGSTSEKAEKGDVVTLFTLGRRTPQVHLWGPDGGLTELGAHNLVRLLGRLFQALPPQC